MSGYDVLSFDLDRTLCRYRRPGAELLEDAFDTLDIEPFITMVEYSARFDEFAEDSPDVETLRLRTFRAIADDKDVDRSLADQVARFYNEHRDPAGVEPMPGAIEVVEQTATHHRLALITNGFAPVQAAKVEALGIEELFDIVVYAGTDTAFKPDPEPFDHVTATLGVPVERAVHIGDSLDHDVLGAKQAGLAAVWIEQAWSMPSTRDVRPDYIVRSIDELLPYPWAVDSP